MSLTEVVSKVVDDNEMIVLQYETTNTQQQSQLINIDYKGHIYVFKPTQDIKECYNALFQHVIDSCGIKDFNLIYFDGKQVLCFVFTIKLSVVLFFKTK